jgi:hypothetical protein
MVSDHEEQRLVDFIRRRTTVRKPNQIKGQHSDRACSGPDHQLAEFALVHLDDSAGLYGVRRLSVIGIP